MKTALITGITGQDGSYLAELLLAKGYEVHGTMRRSSSFSTERIEHLYVDPNEHATSLHLHYCDLADASALAALVHEVEPDEVYNLGAQSHVMVSFKNPVYTADVDALGTLRLLEAVRRSKKPIRFYQASSSEMFGRVVETPQRESTPFRPQSPYGCAKVYSYWQTRNYRDAYGVYATNGILFNHESPRRGKTFVTRKVTRAAARIKMGLQDQLHLGNLDAKRDWGFAGDYVEAMWLMLQQDVADDYVIATGEQHSVGELVDVAFGLAGLDPQQHVRVDPAYLRPAEVDTLLGDASKARSQLGWQPRVGFEELVGMMFEADLQEAVRERTLVDHGLARKEAS